MTYISLIVPVVHRWFPGSKVILFGSRARGDHNENSDYDILIIGEWNFHALPQKRWQSIEFISSKLSVILNAKVDILLYTQKEVDERLLQPGHVLTHAIKEGRILS